MKSFLFILIFLFYQVNADLILDAQKFYEQGLQASSFKEQQRMFNQALTLYDEAVQQYPLNPLFNHALGNCYFQLGEYAWAVLYYQRALKLNPQEEGVYTALNKAEKILSLPMTPLYSSFFRPLLSAIQRLTLLFWLSLCSLIGACFLLIFNHEGVKKLVVSIWSLTFIIWIITVFIYFFTPIEGILIQSTGLYRDPSFDQPQLLNTPLFAGSKLQILQASANEWIKIRTPDQQVGFIPLSTLRLI